LTAIPAQIDFQNSAVGIRTTEISEDIMKLRHLGLFFAVTLTVMSPLAHASLVSFTASGNFTNGATLSGSVSIDTATGLIGSADLAISGNAAHFTTVTLQQTWPPASPFLTEFEFSNGQATDNLLTFLFPPSSLVGYTGGILCGTSNDPSCFDGTLHYVTNFATKMPDGTIPANSFVQLVSGDLTSAAVPEPSSLFLLGTGALGCLGSLRRKWSR
jgi:hypothetical protein